MGASGWSYFVPYQPDLQQALDDLRERVFQRGDYYLAPPLWQDIEDDEAYVESIAAVCDASMRDEMRDRTYQWLEEMRALGDEPSTIEALQRWNGEEGTHSILDITRTSDDPATTDIMVAAPLFDDTLDAILGTTKPTHAEVEAHEAELMDQRPRYVATYIIVYQDDQPAEIFFAGFSGD